MARVVPRAVAVPTDVDDVVTLVRWAAQDGVPLTARGSGSSMGGGAVGSGVVVDLARLGAAPQVDAHARRVTAGPAVTRDAIDRAAAAHHLTMPVDPSSGPFATIGGMCATNAAGSRSLKYGPMRDWVVALECVFADGTREWVRRGSAPSADAFRRFEEDVAPRIRTASTGSLTHAQVRKDSSGYGLAAWRHTGDALDLIVGSEGTLALIVGVELRLIEAPRATASCLAGFADLETAADAAIALQALGASAVELLDRSFLSIAASEGSVLPIPSGLEALLIIEAEASAPATAEEIARAAAEACRKRGATHVELALDEAAEARVWTLRHAASPILNRLAPRLQSMQLVEDACVPPSALAAYVRGVREALRRARFRGVVFGHAGDAHVHVNALVDVQERDWHARADALVAEVTALVASLGGTLAGEHGDGRLRTPLLAQVWPPETLELFAATKRAFDPAGILNPGVKVALPGARPLEDVKYDPSLPPLAPAARAALDTIAREKGWGRHRLSLVD